MAKKDFTQSCADAFVSKMHTPTAEAAAPTTTPAPMAAPAKQPANTPVKSKQPEEHVTMVLDCTIVEKMRTIAWQDRRKLKEVFLEAMQAYIAKYEKANGTIQTR